MLIRLVYFGTTIDIEVRAMANVMQHLFQLLNGYRKLGAHILIDLVYIVASSELQINWSET